MRWEDVKSTLKRRMMNEENERDPRVEEVTIVDQHIARISKAKVRRAFRRMKSGTTVGTDDIPVEVWKCPGEVAVEFLTRTSSKILDTTKIREEWRRRLLVLIFKNKGRCAELWKLQRNKVNESHNEVMGKSSGG